jgi:hypothetical protein
VPAATARERKYLMINTEKENRLLQANRVGKFLPLGILTTAAHFST